MYIYIYIFIYLCVFSNFKNHMLRKPIETKWEINGKSIGYHIYTIYVYNYIFIYIQIIDTNPASRLGLADQIQNSWAAGPWGLPAGPTR